MALTVSAVVFVSATVVAQSYFYPRFVIALLPVTIAAIVWALADLNWSRFSFSILLLSLWLAIYLKPQAFLLSVPYAPLRDAATYVQAESTGKEKPPLIACYGLGREVMPVYEPRCVPLETRADVAAVIQRAKSEQRGLLVIYGYNDFNRAMLADGFALLDDKSLFEEAKVFDGLEPDFRFRVLRMAP